MIYIICLWQLALKLQSYQLDATSIEELMSRHERDMNCFNLGKRWVVKTDMAIHQNQSDINNCRSIRALIFAYIVAHEHN